MPTMRMRLAMPTKRMWGQISLCGAIVSLSTVLYMHWRLKDRVRNSEYYRLAIQTLRQHKGAVGLLGEPIKESGFSISNLKNTCNTDKAQFQVSVHGTKDRGTVYFWASNNRGNGWLIDRLELETKQHPHTRFLLKKPQPQLEENQTKSIVIDVPEPKAISIPKPAEEAKQMEKQPVQNEVQEQEQEQLTEQQPESHLDHQHDQEQEHDGYEAPNYQPPNSTCAQPLHQQQGQEPLPYIQTAEGGSMR